MNLYLLFFFFSFLFFFFFNDTATTEIYTLSLHDALPVPQPEGDELTARAVAAEHHLIPLRREPRVLHSHVVLVGEEVRDAVVADRLAEHRPGRGGTLVQRVRPVLDPYLLLVGRVPGIRHVPGCEDAGRGGLQPGAHHDAVAYVQPRRGGQP